MKKVKPLTKLPPCLTLKRLRISRIFNLEWQLKKSWKTRPSRNCFRLWLRDYLYLERWRRERLLCRFWQRNSLPSLWTCIRVPSQQTQILQDQRLGGFLSIKGKAPFFLYYNSAIWLRLTSATVSFPNMVMIIFTLLLSISVILPV